MESYIYIIMIAVVILIRTIIKERAKNKRIDKLKNLEDSKIESIGYYEKKSKSKDFSILNLFSKQDQNNS